MMLGKCCYISAGLKYLGEQHPSALLVDGHRQSGQHGHSTPLPRGQPIKAE